MVLSESHHFMTAGDHDDGELKVFRIESEIRARLPRHQGVEDDGVYPIGFQRVAHRSTARGNGDAIAALFEHPTDDIGNVAVIIDDEDVLPQDMMLKIAAGYDDLAERAEQRSKRKPQV